MCFEMECLLLITLCAPALRAVVLHEEALHRVGRRRGPEALSGGDAPPVQGRDRAEARVRRDLQLF
jgi:hypothetical protein